MIEKRVQPAIRALRAYDPGHDLAALRRASSAPLIELGSNENPYGPSPEALTAAEHALADAALYPDPRGGDLKTALSHLHGVPISHFILGNGSHELLMQMAQVFAGQGSRVLASQYGFAVYAIAAAAAGATFEAAPSFGMDHAMPFGHDLNAIAAAITPETSLIYLANPNNPTGTWYSADHFNHFMQRVPADVIVVVDEAYADFVTAPEWATALPLVSSHPNLVVLRTFSKAHALAGLRVGYGVAQPGLLSWLERVRESFNVNLPGLAAAEASLSDRAHLRAGLEANDGERIRVAAELRNLGLFVFPSQTNFLLVRFGQSANVIDDELRSQGIVVRPMAGYGLPDCLRITLGTKAQNDRWVSALAQLVVQTCESRT